MSKRKTKYVCTTCGSDDVRLDAWAEWDVDSQEWVLAQTFDQAHCEKCKGECKIEEEFIDNKESAT